MTDKELKELKDTLWYSADVLRASAHLAANKYGQPLLYAKTEEEIQPDNVYQMHGSQISVKTLDLNLPFVEIAAQMDRIVESHFTGVIKAD